MFLDHWRKFEALIQIYRLRSFFAGIGSGKLSQHCLVMKRFTSLDVTPGCAESRLKLMGTPTNYVTE